MRAKEPRRTFAPLGKNSLPKACLAVSFRTNYLEGQGDLVSRLIMGIIKGTIWVIGVINLLTKSP